MLEEKDIERLGKFCKNILQENFDKFDYFHEVDRQISVEENKTLLLEKINQKFPRTIEYSIGTLKKDIDTLKEKEEYERNENRNKPVESELLLKEVFGNKRVVGLVGEKDEGKTNNLMALIKNFREFNKETEIYVFGLNKEALKWVKQYKKVYEVSSIKQLSNKKNCLIIIDELQRLRLNNRRYKELLDNFIDFIYHNNNWLILTSPNVREFNTIIGSKIEGWCLKSLKLTNVVNGSQLKNAVMGYNGRFKVIDDICIEKNNLLIINDDYEKILDLKYIKEADSKINNLDIFELKKSK